MSYLYDPHINPAFDATRRQIERSLNSIEQKLRRRRLLEQDLEREDRFFLQRTNPYIGSAPMLTEPPLFFPPTNVLDKELLLHQDYMEKINRLRFQREHLHHSNKQDYSDAKLYAEIEKVKNMNRSRDYRSIQYEEDDQLLIRKYQDGTRAEQYNKQLNNIDRQIQKSRSRQKVYPSSASKYGGVSNQINTYSRHLNNYENRNYQSKEQLRNNIQSGNHKFNSLNADNKPVQPSNYQTPYEKLQNRSENKFASSSKKNVRRPLSPQFRENSKSPGNAKNRKVRFDNQQVNRAVNQDSSDNQTPKKPFIDNQMRNSKENRTLSPYGKISQTERSTRKKRKSNSRSLSRSQNKSQNQSYFESINPLKNSGLGRSNVSGKFYQNDTMKKIQNRIKLATVAYGSGKYKYKSIEQQLDYLLTRFDKQSRTRKDIKDKINGMDFVIKKHGMVTD